MGRYGSITEKSGIIRGVSSRGKCFLSAIILVCFAMLAAFQYPVRSETDDPAIDLGLSSEYYREGKAPEGWKLTWFRRLRGADAKWVEEDGVRAVRLHSKAALTFLERTVDIDVKQYPVVSWKWKVENILRGIDERTMEGDDHPIRIFFVFAPEESKHSFWFRLKRFLYLDRIHGHPSGGRFTEYLWSSHLKPGDVIDDPGNPHQKLMVVEGGSAKLGIWLSYKRNLYEDFKNLYGEEPRRLIFIGVLNDTDQTGQTAVSSIADLRFHRK